MQRSDESDKLTFPWHTVPAIVPSSSLLMMASSADATTLARPSWAISLGSRAILNDLHQSRRHGAVSRFREVHIKAARVVCSLFSEQRNEAVRKCGLANFQSSSIRSALRE